MSISEEIKAINNKIKQNKSQNNLDRQDTKISALSSGNVSKYKFLFATMFYHKKLRQSRDLNIYYYEKNQKHNLVLQKNNAKHQTTLLVFESHKKEEEM